MYASASASCICETAQRRLIGSSHRQGYIASAQACEGGSVAEGGQKVFEREAVGYHNPCRKEHLLPRAYAGGRAGDDSRAACQRSER